MHLTYSTRPCQLFCQMLQKPEAQGLTRRVLFFVIFTIFVLLNMKMIGKQYIGIMV